MSAQFLTDAVTILLIAWIVPGTWISVGILTQKSKTQGFCVLPNFAGLMYRTTAATGPLWGAVVFSAYLVHNHSADLEYRYRIVESFS